MVNLLCFVLLFGHHCFFVTIITSLLYIFAFYSVSNPEVNRDVYYGAPCVKLRNIKFCIIFLVNFG